LFQSSSLDPLHPSIIDNLFLASQYSNKQVTSRHLDRHTSDNKPTSTHTFKHTTPELFIMSSVVEKVTDAATNAMNDVTNALANTSLTGKSADDKNAANNDAVLASAAEGRRLYIGNLAYATTEGELKEFFKGYLV
jgi:hypothetical protein